jgi:hypothetical protein
LVAAILNGVMQITLICISLMISDVENFFHIPTGWPFRFVLLRNVYLSLLAIFNETVFWGDTELFPFWGIT